MDRQLLQMTRLIEELLDVARISQGKIVLSKELVDLNAIVAQSVETTQPLVDGRGQTIRLTLSDHPIWVNADFARLNQVVSKLLNNASKYSSTGSDIELEVASDEVGATVSVRDHGIGIDAELLPHIFDLFAQGSQGLDRAQGGLGVGLTLAQRLTEMHAGRIEADSSGPTQGSHFKIWLPRVTSEAVPQAELAITVAASAQAAIGHRVLVVDDNRDAALSMAAILEIGGHHVRTASDGEEALACAVAYRPEVVVLDIGLPLLDGYEVAHRMGKMPETAHALFVALTGYGQKEDLQAAREAGFDYHFVKPADPMRVLACIQNWSETSRPAAHGQGAAQPTS
jgi:CheY-like chemotaxis protein/anti-sigma regulatory factor (Ser/Thr protein kinase)